MSLQGRGLTGKLANDMSKEISPEQEKLMAQRQRALDAAMLQIQKDFGENAIMRLGDKKTMEVEVIPTGNTR